MEKLIINKYKPQKIEDYMYDESIKASLYSLINLNEMTFILNGESGCGKTSLMESLVASYFNEKQSKENVLKINSISEQGINYFRNEVKLFCQTNCTIVNKKKLIIFDDFDQITEQCQQVFRNYIDKYENKVGFIISTSNLHKIINSIQSRFLVINLLKPSRNDVFAFCKKIIEKENIKVTDNIINHILDLTNNTIHSTLNYLEKISLIDKPIDTYEINDALTHINYKLFDHYFSYIEEKNLTMSIKILMELFDDGFSVIDILDALFQYIKHSNILTEEIKYKIIPIICKYITIFYDIHENEVELIFLTNNLFDIF